MARTELTLQTCIRTGLNTSYSAAQADGHAINNVSHKTFIHVVNDNASACTVTVTTPNTVDGQAIADLTVSVPASEERMIGPFPHAVYCKNDSALSIVHAVWVDYSVQASVTVAAVKLPDPTY